MEPGHLCGKSTTSRVSSRATQHEYGYTVRALKKYKKQPILGKEEDQRQCYDDPTGICMMEHTRRVSCILAVDAV